MLQLTCLESRETPSGTQLPSNDPLGKFPPPEKVMVEVLQITSVLAMVNPTIPGAVMVGYELSPGSVPTK